MKKPRLHARYLLSRLCGEMGPWGRYAAATSKARNRWLASVVVLESIMLTLFAWSSTCGDVKLLWHKTLGDDVRAARIAITPTGDRLVATPWMFEEPASTNNALFVLAETGDTLWQYTPPPKEHLGGIAITPDGQRVFCDYWTEPRLAEPCPYPEIGGRPAGETEIMPLDKVAYAGGIYCFNATGQVLWKTHEEAAEVCCPGSSPLGSVKQATGDRLLVVKPGEECDRAVALLDFSGRIVFCRDFTQEDQVQRVVISADGQSLVIGSRDDVRVTDPVTGRASDINGVGLARTGGAVSRDGKLLFVDPVSSGAVALADTAGQLKWTYNFPKSWPASIVPSSGQFAGQRKIIAGPHLIGAGPQGVSVVLVRGPRRVLFRFPPGSYSPQQIELPALEEFHEGTFLSPDGTVVAIIRVLPTDEGTDNRRLHLMLFAESGVFLGELDLGEWRHAWRRPLAVEFTNPAKYLAISAGPDLYFIEVDR